MWRPRQAGHGQTIGRMRAASPGQGERYYVHLLLGQVRGALSFDDLRTVDGRLCASFKEACMLRGFLEDDRDLRAALAEGARSQMPSVLRQLLAQILLFGQPADPGALWEEFQEALCDDFLHAERVVRAAPPHCGVSTPTLRRDAACLQNGPVSQQTCNEGCRPCRCLPAERVSLIVGTAAL